MIQTPLFHPVYTVKYYDVIYSEILWKWQKKVKK